MTGNYNPESRSMTPVVITVLVSLILGFSGVYALYNVVKKSNVEYVELNSAVLGDTLSFTLADGLRCKMVYSLTDPNTMLGDVRRAAKECAKKRVLEDIIVSDKYFRQDIHTSLGERILKIHALLIEKPKE